MARSLGLACRLLHAYDFCIRQACNNTCSCMPVQDKCRNRHPPLARGCNQLPVTSPCTLKRDRAAAWRAHNASLQAPRAHPANPQDALQTADQHAAPTILIRDSQVQSGSRHHMDIMDQAAADQRVRCLVNSDAEPPQHPASQTATNRVVDSFQNVLQPHSQPAPQQAAGKGIGIVAAAPAGRKKPTYARLGIANAHHKIADNAAGAADTQSV